MVEHRRLKCMSTVAAPAGPLTERSALALAEAIRAREVSARDVVEAHIERLRAVQPRLNALAAERFAAARDEADAADERVGAASDGERLPPLLGVPCTIKESIAVGGMPDCARLVARRHLRAPESAPVVARLVEAVPFPPQPLTTSRAIIGVR